MVQKAIEALPRFLKENLRNLAIVVEDLPGEDLIREMHLGSPYELLGLYQGVPLNKRGFFYGNVLPDRIVLFRKSIKASSKDPDDAVRLIKDVLVHEVGHYLGLEEQDLEKLER